MSKRIRRNLPLLKMIFKAPASQRKVILESASTDLILSLCEIALNLRRGNIPLTESQLRKVKRQKAKIIYMSRKNTSVARKRKTINQSGGFLLPLLSVAVPFLTSLIASRQG